MASYSFIKLIAKLLIITLFLFERYYYYSELKHTSKDKSYLHEEIVNGFEIDYNKIDRKYNEHEIFTMPLVKYFVQKFENFTEHNSKTTEQNSFEYVFITNNNKKKEIKFKFYFLTVYDLFLSTLLIFFTFSDSLIANASLLGLTGLRILNYLLHQIKDFPIKKIYHDTYKLIQDIVKKDFKQIWQDIKNLITAERPLGLNVLIFSLLSILFLYLLSEKYFRQTSLDFSSVAKAASETRRIIEEKMGVKKEYQVSSSVKITTNEKEKSSQDIMNLKTTESEELSHSPEYRSNFAKVENKQSEVTKRGRPTTPSKRREKTTL